MEHFFNNEVLYISEGPKLQKFSALWNMIQHMVEFYVDVELNYQQWGF